MDRIFGDPHLKEVYGYAAHAFVDKVKSRPCQAADLLAWQWFTDTKRRVQGTRPNPRKDLVSLVETKHQTMHASARVLHNMLSEIVRINSGGAPVSRGPRA
jgi:hypothetical protein